jgi:DNA-binding response OmpR family regulator
MRPKQRILIIDANEIRASQLLFPITTTGKYRVAIATTAAEAREIIGELLPDLVIAKWPTPVDLRSLIGIPELKYAPMLLLASRPTMDAVEFPASRMLIRPCMADLLETVHLLCARKRGARKGSLRMPVKSVGMAEAVPAERRLA